MPTETGGGSPIGPEATGEAGGGSPITPISTGETGGGSPLDFSAPPYPPLYFREPYASAAYAERFPFDPAYPEDGGLLCEVQGPWPIAGPYRVRLRDQDGNYYGAKYTEGCYGAVLGLGDAIYANASRQFIRFAFPRCPRGTYDLVVDWDGGASSFESLQAVRSVPRTFLQFAQVLLGAPAYGAYLELVLG